MSNSLRIGKKALTIAVAAATILWTVGLTSFVAPQASAASFGDLIKGETLSTVYYYGSDGQRYSFPNEKTFFSWNADFSGVVTISDAELADITLAGNIAYRPGSRWVKITSDAKVYAVARDGSIHWIEDEATAVGLAGDSWNTFIDDVPDVFFVDYTVGDSLSDASMGYEGMLWSDGTDTYLIWDGAARKVSSAGMTANGLKSGFVLSGSGVDTSTLTSGTEVTGALAYLTDAAQMVETETVAASQDVSVSFSGSPSASTLIAGQSVADLAHVTLTNNSGSSVTLNTVSFSRLGVSSDTTLANLYLFNGYVRATDSATISDGKVRFNDAGGITTIAAGSSVTMAVRSDIAASTNGQTVGLRLSAASDLAFSGGGAASGSFPLEGAIHTIASSPSTFGTADFTGSTTPSAATIDPQEGARVFERTLSVGSNELLLKVVRARNIGSIDAADIQNWSLYVGGVKRGASVAMEDEDGYVTFDLSADPIRLTTGNHQVKVLADVIGGSGRTVTVGLRNSADFIAVDEDYGQPVLATVGASTFSAMDAGAQTIASGSLTFTKATDSPSGNVTETASGVTLGKWTVKAFGEKMKVEKLRFAFTESDGDDVTLRNGAVFLNGTQVGSTAGLEANAGAGTDYTEYTFGSSFIVTPGTPATVEIRADIYDSDGTDNIEAADTILAEISNMASTSNVQRMTSGSYIDAPSGAVVTAGTLTVTAATLTVAKNGSYGNQTIVDPKTAYKIGSFSATAGTSEGINLTDFNVDLDTDTSAATTDLFNIYVEYGPAGNMTTSSTKGSVAETANSWSINYELAAGDTIFFNVYADIDSAISDAETVIAVFDLNGTSLLSGSSPTTNEVAGQTITVGSGSFTPSLDGSSPVARNVAGNQEVEAAKFKFAAQNESYYVKELTFGVTNANDASAIDSVRVYNGDTLLGSAVFNQSSNTQALLTGLNVSVPSNTNKTLSAKLQLNTIGTGAGYTSRDVQLTLQSVKYADSQGAETTDAATDPVGNELRVYKAIPTVTHVDLSNSTLVNGQARDVYKFQITATGGDIALKQLKLPITFTDGVDADTLELDTWKLYKNGADVSTSSSSVALESEDGTSIESGTGVGDDTFTGGSANTDVYVIWDTSEEVISSGETVTYTLRATPRGFDSDSDTGDEDYFTIYLEGDSAHKDGGTNANTGVSGVCLDDTGTAGNIWQLGDTASLGTACTATDTNSAAASFIWSDMSGAGHDGTETTASDWAAGYLVLNLDLDGETWSK